MMRDFLHNEYKFFLKFEEFKIPSPIHFSTLLVGEFVIQWINARHNQSVMWWIHITCSLRPHNWLVVPSTLVRWAKLEPEKPICYPVDWLICKKDWDSLQTSRLSISNSMATNTVNLSPLPSSSSIRLISSYSPKTDPNLSFYTRFRPSVHLISSVSSKPYRSTFKPRSLVIAAAVKTLSETELLAVPLTAEEYNLNLPSESGVYAVYDQNDDLQFIGISRNIAASVLAHLKSVPELCGSVKVRIFYQTASYRCFINDSVFLFSLILTWIFRNSHLIYQKNKRSRSLNEGYLYGSSVI